MVNRKELLTRAIENGFPRREEGYPLLLPEASGVPAEEYTVYGNTADGAAVGEKTRNLLDCSLFVNSDTGSGMTTQYLEEEQCFLINGTALEGKYSTYRLTRLNLKITPNTYFSISTRYVSGSIDKTNCTTQYEYSLVYFGKNDEPNQITNWCAVNLATSDQPYRVNENRLCDCNYITAVWFYISPGIVFDNYKVKIQLEEGSAATSFEPYGYKIPLVNGEEETVLYLPAPLGAGETVNSTEASLPPLPLHEGTNQITAATAAPPAKIRVDYQARVKAESHNAG